MCSWVSSQIVHCFEINMLAYWIVSDFMYDQKFGLNKIWDIRLSPETEKYTKSFMYLKFFTILNTTCYHQKSQVIIFITSNNMCL